MRLAERVEPRLYMATFVAECLAVLVHPSTPPVHVELEGCRAAVLGDDGEALERTQGETPEIAVATLIQSLARRHYQQVTKKPNGRCGHNGA